MARELGMRRDPNIVYIINFTDTRRSRDSDQRPSPAPVLHRYEKLVFFRSRL